MQNYLAPRPIYDPKKTPYHVPRDMKQNKAQFQCIFSQQYYKGKPSEGQLRRWCLEVPCSVNLNLLNVCQIVKEDRFQDRGTTDRKQFKIFSRFLRKVAVPFYMRNKSKFDILPVNTNNFREDMFIQIYNFELLPSLTNCEQNEDLDESSCFSESQECATHLTGAGDQLQNSSSLVIMLDTSSEVLPSVNHGDLCQKTSSRRTEAPELESPLTGTGDQLQNNSFLDNALDASSEVLPSVPPLVNHFELCQKTSSRRTEAPELESPLTETNDQLQNSSSLNGMCCSSSDVLPAQEVGFTQPLPTYTEVMNDEYLVTSTQT